MVERIITEGSKVELQRLASVAQNRREGTDKEVKTYYSLVSEVLDEDRIKITMPLEKGRIVSLSVNSRYNACFYTPHGLYQGGDPMPGASKPPGHRGHTHPADGNLLPGPPLRQAGPGCGRPIGAVYGGPSQGMEG